MREAGEAYLSKHNNFISVDGTSSQTKLKDSSIDIITVAQAFHWFDKESDDVSKPFTYKEFKRILKPTTIKEKNVMLLWNHRNNETALMKDYEKLCEDYGTDYETVAVEKVVNDQVIDSFFGGNNNVEKTVIPVKQLCDFEGFLGRILSGIFIYLSRCSVCFFFFFFFF